MTVVSSVLQVGMECDDTARSTGDSCSKEEGDRIKRNEQKSDGGGEGGGGGRGEKQGSRRGGKVESSTDSPGLKTPEDGESTQRETHKRRHRRKKLLMGTSEREDDSSVPIVTIEGATPSPRPPSGIADENNNREGRNEEAEDDEEDFEDDEDVGEEEQTEEEEEDREMTVEEKRDMHLAVKSGDIDLLEDCLDKPNSDMNMVWFRENLLMTAIREGHKEMAEFLLDNGVDHTYSTSLVGLRESSKGTSLDRYEMSCRQMAYDHEMFEIVELIDLLQNQLFPFVRPAERTPRFRRPKPPTPSESEAGSGSEEEGEGGGGESGSGSQSDTEGSGGSERKSPRRRRRKRKGKKKSTPLGESGAEESEMNKTTGTGSMFGEGTEVDSGHHSLGSSKLRIAMVREHEKLTERDENLPSSESATSPRRPTSESEKGEEKSNVDRSDKSEVAGSRVRDEGYGSISQKSPTPCPSPEMKPLWTPVEPSNHFKSTKSALGVRKSNFVYLKSHTGQPPGLTVGTSALESRPLRWRKISAVGSYANESKNWHVKNEAEEGEGRVEISKICLDPRAVSSLHSAPRRSSSSTMASTLTSSSDIKTSSAPSDKTGVLNSTSSSVASYMRPTKSTMTKQRLTPNFVKSYGGLEFTHVIDSQNRALVDLKDKLSTSKLHSFPGYRHSVPHIAPNRVVQKRNNPLSFRS